MPALSFQKQFAPLVESGEKRTTIRAKRKRPIKTGDKLYLYTGMRTRHCRKLMETTCKSSTDIIITSAGFVLDNENEDGRINVNKWYPKGSRACQKLARNDGFNSYDELVEYFIPDNGSGPFHGDLIQW